MRRGSTVPRTPGANRSRAVRRPINPVGFHGLDRVSIDINTQPVPIAMNTGFLYGSTQTGGLFRSDNMGTTWSFVQNPGHVVSAIVPTSLGEILTTNGGSIYLSTGWTINPATATFAIVLNADPPAFFLPHQLDGQGLKFIVSEYAALGVYPGRYVSISTNGGVTWNRRFTSGAGLNSHLHASTYDAANDRFWFVEGHSATDPSTGIGGLYSSTDNGLTWVHNVSPLVHHNGGYIPIRSSIYGLACGSDQYQNGLWVFPNTEDPIVGVPQLAWTWHPAVPYLAGIGFGVSVCRDNYGAVYMGYTIVNGVVTNGPIIVMSNGRTASLVYEFTDAVTPGDRVNTVVVNDNVIAGWLRANGVNETFRAFLW